MPPGKRASLKKKYRITAGSTLRRIRKLFSMCRRSSVSRQLCAAWHHAADAVQRSRTCLRACSQSYCAGIMLRRAVESTLLAFDDGEKRIGVAVGNLLTRHAQALAVIENRNRACRFAALGALLTEWQPQALVVGLPTHPDGAPHVMTEQALRFGRQLKGRFGLPVLWVDERYSSVSAAAQRDAAPLDAIAARIILQQFFDEYAREPSAIERAR